jgi:ABC-type amino acid transport system permease subunit
MEVAAHLKCVCEDLVVSFRKAAKKSTLLNMKLYFYLNDVLKYFPRERDSLKFPEQDLVNNKSAYIHRDKFQKLKSVSELQLGLILT